MKAIVLVMVLSITATSALAQHKKSLTMDDVSPSTTPTRNEPTPASEEEKKWQDRLFEAEMAQLDLKLRIAKDEKNTALKVELKKKQEEAEQIKQEGRGLGYKERRPYELEYRERYVKLRIEMLEEEKKSVTTRRSTGSQNIYVESDRTKKRSRQLRTSAPIVDTKKVEAKLTKLEQLEEQIEQLTDEGRRLGVPAGVFRD